ncbi:hypothetical protein MNBD_GAMMA23-748 [hydrothermal vent metagenome]|uniref:Uncharacterized protein n=1 Tax=hydrothermal vent metagenome TaxID=652676 RepID=A0A3B1AIY1_9ZZZZ
MKFYLVPIGEQFSFQGLAYTKSGPLTASAELDGKSKMIPRSANVQLLNSAKLAVPEAVKENLMSVNDILVMVNDYHSESLADIQSAVNEKTYEGIKQKINMAYDDLVSKIKLSG